MIEEIIELLETAYTEKDWDLVLDAIQLLNEIADDGFPPSEEDEENDILSTDRF